MKKTAYTTWAGIFIVAAAANLVGESRCEAQTKKLSYLGNSPLRGYDDAPGVGVLIAQPAPNVLAGYSNKTGKWVSYKAPAGVRLIPVLSGAVAGVHSTPPQKEVIAFSGVTGKWVTHKVEGDKAKVGSPVVADGIVFQRTGKHIYAFSAELGVWDVLESEAAASINGGMVIAVTANSISVFSAHTGTWATFKAESD